MAVIGSSTLNVVPKVQGGLANAITKEIKSADLGGVGKSAGSSLMGGLTSGFSIGLWSSVTQRAIDVVTNSIDSAVSRVDTLSNYPKVLSNLVMQTGASQAEATAQAQRSIDTLSSSLDNLPTRLDDMANVVQGVYAATAKYGTSLDTATDAGLALNSMLLAGGKSTQVVNAAMEQFEQMLAKGKPDMQDWRSLVSAAPAQMDQLAKSMLGVNATADDLYAALGGGRAGDYDGPFEWGSLSMGEFVDRFAAMKTDFVGQAEDAQSGINTAFANMQNAVTKGVARTIDALGSDKVASAVNDVKGAINDVFGKEGAGGLVDFAAEAAPAVWDLWDALKGAGEAVAPQVSNLADAIGGGLVAATEVGASALRSFSLGWRATADDFEYGSSGYRLFGDSVQALSSMAEETGQSIDVMGTTIEHASERSMRATLAAWEAHKGYKDVMYEGSRATAQATREWQTMTGELEYAATVIDAYAGKSELGAAQQRELRDAVGKVNKVCGTQYEVVGDANEVLDRNTGEVQKNTDEIWRNVRAREAQGRAEALGVAREAADRNYSAAAMDLQSQKDAAKAAGDAIGALLEKYDDLDAIRAAANRGDREATGPWQSFLTAGQNAAEAEASLRAAAQASSELAAEQEALMLKASGAELTMGQLALTCDTATLAFNEGGKMAQLSITDFADALEACCTDADALADALDDPERAASIVSAYDGTASSLSGIFAELGVGWDEVAARNLDAQGSIRKTEEFLSQLDSTGTSALYGMGESASSFSAKLAEAGVSTERLSEIGSERFSEMLVSCGGDLDELVSRIEGYNSVPISEKAGGVTVDDASLTDAQGNVWTWNGTEFKNQYGTAIVDDQQLIDSQNRVWVWNGTELVPLNTYVGVDDSDVYAAQSSVEGLRASYDGTTIATSFWNVVQSVQRVVSETLGFATGGHVVPRHAAGYFATGPTLTNFGLVGEDGVEYVRNNDDGTSDVYPISNHRYADPLADSIAARMSELGARGVTNNYITVNAAGDTGDEIARAITRELRAHQLMVGGR